jgi:hypothetical protein
MLKNQIAEHVPIIDVKASIKDKIPNDLLTYFSKDNSVLHINYPIEVYPTKVTSLKLDKVNEIEKKLIGIKGQYLIFEDGNVLNIRSHAGCRVYIDF